MSNATPSDEGAQEPPASEDDELLSPPPLPRERAAAEAKRRTEPPPLPPRPSPPKSPPKKPKPRLVYGLGALVILGAGALVRPHARAAWRRRSARLQARALDREAKRTVERLERELTGR